MKKIHRYSLMLLLLAGFAFGSYSLVGMPAQADVLGARSTSKRDLSAIDGQTIEVSDVQTLPVTASPVSATQAAALRDGSYIGNREYAFYGYVRLKAIVQNGAVAKIQVIEYPNHSGTSQYINSVALPYLIQEAIQAQSAQIDLVSGATLTSEAFVKSLDSALTKAGA